MTSPSIKNWLARPGVVFSAAFLLRSVVMLLLFYQNSFSYGWATNEAAAIARSVVLGHGYGNIFPGAAGPTAWLAPGYPLLLAAIFLVFGMGAASVFVAVLLNVLFASLTSVVILKIGGLQRVPQVGVVGAWLWVISPHGLVLPYLAWDTMLSGLLLAVSVWLSLKAATSGSMRIWVLCGAVWGLVGLTSPALLAALPVVLFYLWWRGRKVAHLIALTVAVLAVLAPWCVRNYFVMHDGFMLRSNGWNEVYYGNIDYAEYPLKKSGDFQRLGEIEYCRMLKARIQSYIAAHPGEFLLRALERIPSFWVMPPQFGPMPVIMALLLPFGVVFAFRSLGIDALPLAGVVVFCPLIYYFCYSYSRYRYPIEPVVSVLCGYAIVFGVESIRMRRRGRVVSEV